MDRIMRGENISTNKWKYSGGKLREKGAESLSDQELLTIMISTDVKLQVLEEVDWTKLK